MVQTRLAGLPGARFVGGIGGLFELDGAPLNSLRAIEGRVSGQDGSRTLTPLIWTTVSGDYLRAMGIPLVAGRYFSSGDTAQAPLVAIIDELWPRSIGQLNTRSVKGSRAKMRVDGTMIG
jgi:hypothetical protein